MIHSREKEYDAIILKTTPKSESDLIIEVFGDRGVISLLARGGRNSRKRFGGRLQPYVSGMFHVEHNSRNRLPILKGVYVTTIRPWISSKYERLTCASAMSRTLLKTYLNNDSDTRLLRKLFESLLDEMKNIETQEAYDSLQLTLIYGLLLEEGALAHPPTCQRCGEEVEKELCFVPATTESICADCARHTRFHPSIQLAPQWLHALKEYADSRLENLDTPPPLFEAEQADRLLRMFRIVYRENFSH